MASHVVNLHWLNPDAKEDQRVRLTTEGRSCKSVDCVIEQVDRAIWSMHSDTAQINAQLDLKRVESKLSERLSNVLSLVEQHWMLTGRPISPVEVAEEMPDEFGNNGRQKAFQALDALYRKRLLEKIKRSDGKRCTVAVFQPLKERRCS